MMVYLASQFSLAKWIHIYGFVQLACNIDKKYVKLLVKISHIYSAFKIQVLTTSAINAETISEFLSLPQQYIGKKSAKDSAETFVYYVGNGFCIP